LPTAYSLKGEAMAAIEEIIFVGAAGFAVVIVISVVVIIGVRQEERARSFGDEMPPGVFALLARVVLGRYVRKERRPASIYPDDLPGPREDCVGPRR
jgi:hypothetical protein